MYPSVEQGCEANANLVEPQIGHGLIGNSLFTFNNANKVFFCFQREESKSELRSFAISR